MTFSAYFSTASHKKSQELKISNEILECNISVPCTGLDPSKKYIT